MTSTQWIFGALIVATLGCHRSETPAARVDVWIAGDLHLGEGGADPLAAIGAATGNGIGVVNLEGPIGDGADDSSARRLVNAPAAVAVLTSHGVAVVGIANNHSGDLGAGGRRDTAAELERAGLKPAGGAAGVARLTLGRWRVAVTAHDLAGGVPGSLGGDIARAKEDSDLLIATFHVTGPPSYLPAPELRKAVDVAVTAGADVVAAHGTHAIGPVERRGQTVIAWGLGNLAFHCDCTREEDGLVLRVSASARGIDARIVPIEAGLGGKPARLHPDPELIFDLLGKLGSTPLHPEGSSATF